MDENVVDTLKRMHERLAEAIADAKKFEEKSNKAAGTRVTKAMQEVRKAAKEIRATVFEMKKEM